MSAPVSMMDFAGIVLPSGRTDGILCMLEAYFDDSGTHEDFDVVLWAGLFGNRYQWEMFNHLWSQKLADPSPGKPAINQFHMYDCYNSRGEFLGWKREATDFLAHELTQIILKTMLRGYAIAVSRKDWDRAFPGLWREAFGDAEGICLRNIYLQLIEQVKQTGESRIAITFDRRPHRERENRAVFDVFDRYQKQENTTDPRLVSIAFGLASELLPLQAADLFAWECYQHANDVIHSRSRRLAIKRKNLVSLIASKRIALGIADGEAISQMRAAFAGDEASVEQVAKHVKAMMS